MTPLDSQWSHDWNACLHFYPLTGLGCGGGGKGLNCTKHCEIGSNIRGIYCLCSAGFCDIVLNSYLIFFPRGNGNEGEAPSGLTYGKYKLLGIVVSESDEVGMAFLMESYVIEFEMPILSAIKYLVNCVTK